MNVEMQRLFVTTGYLFKHSDLDKAVVNGGHKQAKDQGNDFTSGLALP